MNLNEAENKLQTEISNKLNELVKKTLIEYAEIMHNAVNNSGVRVIPGFDGKAMIVNEIFMFIQFVGLMMRRYSDSMKYSVDSANDVMNNPAKLVEMLMDPEMREELFKIMGKNK